MTRKLRKSIEKDFINCIKKQRRKSKRKSKT